MVRRIRKYLCVAAWLLCSLSGFAQYSVNFVNSVVTTIDGNAHPTGIIYDNGGPRRNYSNNFAGMVRIDADMGDTIVLWGHVKTEGACDQLFVYEGNGREGLIGAYCKDTSFALQSTTGYMSLWFNTDRSVVDSGFTLRYEIHFNSCSNNVMELEAADIASTSVHLRWASVDTNGPFLLSYADRDTVLNHCYCDVTGLISDTNYTFTVVSLADTGNVYCPRSCTIHTPCFIANISGARPLIGRRDSIVLVADSADSYIWNTGDTTRQIVVRDTGEYYVVAVTAGGCSDTARARVIRVGLVLEMNIPPCLCPGDHADIRVGFEPDATIRIIPGSAVLSEARQIFLPDGIHCDPYGCSYRSEQEFSGFPAGARIEDVNDIRYVMLNIEHSWLGDLYMNITCPNGQSSNILRYGGVGTSACNSSITDDCRGWNPGNNASLGSYLGLALDSSDTQYPCDSLAPLNRHGQGWRYCWSNATDAGYQYAPGDGLMYRAWNMVHSSIDSSDVLHGRQFYHPDDSFDNLVGCPMNGTWYIEVIDGWSEDNGYIFGWELALDSNRLMRNSYNPSLDSCALVGPWYQRLTDTTFIITAPLNLSHDTLVKYTLHIYDSNDNVFDTVFYIQFRAPRFVTIYDTVTENELPYTYNDSIFTGDVSNYLFHLHMSGDCHCDSTLIYNLFVKRSSSFTKDTAICDNVPLPFTWRGYDFAAPGTIIDTIPNHWRLDSVVTLTLSLLPTFIDTISANICSYEHFDWGDETYSSPGLYTLFSLSSMRGCDSSRYLNLGVHPMQYVDTIVTACDTFTFSSNSYSSSVLDTIFPYGIDTNGCLSSAILHLTVNYSSVSELSEQACDTATRFDTLYYAPFDSLITHFMPNANAVGCDSTVRLSLVIHKSDTIDIYDTICPSQWVDGYSYGDSLYRGPAQFPFDTLLLYHTQTPEQCYRLKQIYLHVNSNSDTAIFDTIVENMAATWSFRGTPLSKDTALRFIDTNAAGCDSLIDYHLLVIPNIHDTVRITLCENDTMHWNGLILPYDTATSVTFHFSNGIDSIVHLILTLKEVPDTLLEASICETGVFSFNQRLLNVAGSYVDTLKTLTLPSCDSIVRLSLSVLDTSVADTMSVACNEFDWHQRHYDSSVVDSLIFANANLNGCDSMLRLHLHVNYSDTVDTYDTICQNLWIAGYSYADSLYSGPAQFPFDTLLLYHTQTPMHCYRLMQIHLHVNSNSDTSIFDTIVENMAATWSFHNTPLSKDTVLLFIDTNAAGCDSLIDYHLHVIPNIHDTVRLTLCENDTMHWNGLILPYDTATSVIFPLPNGADSIVHLILTLKPVTVTDLYQAVCWPQSYSFNGRSCSETGLYIDTLHTETLPSCDSIVRLHLVVNDTSMIDTIAVACGSFDWHNRHYDTSALDSILLPLHNQFGCDSSLRLHLTINNTTHAVYYDTCVENELPRYFHDFVFDTDVAHVFVTISNSNQCDSIIDYSLYVWRNVFDTLYDTICNSQLSTYSFYGQPSHLTPLTDIPLLTHPVLHDVLSARIPSVHRADSILTLYLTVNPDYSTLIIDTFCQLTSYTFDTFVFDTSGNYTVAYTTIDGCDSLCTLSLTQMETYHNYIYDTIHAGGSYRFADSIILTPGSYDHHFRTVRFGCDSLVTLYLYQVYTLYDTIYDTICLGDSLLFAGIYRTLAGTYNDTIPIVNPFTDNTTYVIPIDTIRTLFLTVLPPPLISLTASAFCLEDNPHYILHANTTAPYIQWASYPNDTLIIGGENDPNLFVSPSEPTIYYIFADYQDIPRCPASDSITLSAVPLVNADIVTTPDIVTFDDREVIAFNADDLNVAHHAWTTWYDSDPPLYHNQDTIILEVPITSNDLRILLIVNNEFCADTDTAFVKVLNTTIYFPNVFTPGLDNNNRFFAQGVGILKFEMWIYDRRGDIVFHSTSIDQKWDGTSNGIPCQQATYTYKCRYITNVTPGGWQSHVGTVTLLR